MIIQILLPLILFFIMFTMGLELTLKDFRNVFKVPKAFSIGMTLQVVLLPLIAFGIASIFELPSFLSIGLIIISCCPGGVTSNYLTHIAKGDTALSVSLTAIASVMGILTVPFIIKLGIDNFASETSSDFSIFSAAFKIFLMTTIPVALGMLIRKKFPNFTSKNSSKLGKIAGFFFIALVLGAIIKQREALFQYFPQVGTSILALNIFTMLSAIITSRLMNLPRNQEITLTIECGFQNATLAMVIASTILMNNEYLVVAGIYGVMMFFTAGAYLAIIKKRSA